MNKQELYNKALKAWQIGTPIMSDEEFDKLENEVYPALGIAGDAPLPINMWSIEKDQKCKLLRDHPGKCFIQYKIDGVAILLHYKSGKFKEAYTRGDGQIGQCITHHAKYMCFPKNITSQKGEDVYIIGEAFLDKEVANYMEYKNTRNGVAGLLNHKSEIPKYSHLIRLFVFNMYCSEYKFKSEVEILGRLRLNNFEIPPTFSKIKNALKVDKANLPYDIDGLVIKISDCKLQKVLGYTDRYPKFYSAYKFEAAANTTVLKSIEWQVGRTGIIIPVAHLEPLVLNGATISKASLHSHNRVLEMNIAPGDIVSVKKAGDIIPYIDKVIAKGDNKFPQNLVDCPSCQKAVVQNGAHVVCLNYYCLDKQVEIFIYACKTIGVKGIGPKAALSIITTSSKYSLSNYFEVAKKMNKYKFPLFIPQWKAIQMLGIEGIGKAGAKQAANTGKTLNWFIPENDAEYLTTLLNIEK